MIPEGMKRGVLGYLLINPLRLGMLILLIGTLGIGIRVYLAFLAAPVTAHPGPNTFSTFTIKKGTSLRQIGESLERKKLIKSADFFIWYARWKGKERQIEAGSYRLSSAWTLDEILERIVGGKVITYRVTIPEGYTVNQIARLLASKGLVDEDVFMETLKSGEFDYPFLKEVPSGPERLEGYLFPATYEFQAGMSEKEIVDQMLKTFQKRFSPELQHRAEQMGLSVRQVVILASLVEREAMLDKERPLVAAVFLNRLRSGMRLESCATIQYILGRQKEKLTYEDLKIPSPYNTYLHEGLPPGPIANPGLASIKAVLYPADAKYLYFVARGDGSHIFSMTLREHEIAARQYVGE